MFSGTNNKTEVSGSENTNRDKRIETNRKQMNEREEL